jgi:hypothetical protein
MWQNEAKQSLTQSCVNTWLLFLHMHEVQLLAAT